jgi:peptidoglycan/LPS O-acetylase OafA/YrhL
MIIRRVKAIIMHTNTALESPSEHNFHSVYRPDIDGLRAVAILSVVIFHAFPSLLTGGFVGVDVFFVISGFLISEVSHQRTST